MATTGSNCEAEYAGIIPANTPIITQIEIAMVRILADIYTGKLKRLVSTNVRR